MLRDSPAFHSTISVDSAKAMMGKTPVFMAEIKAFVFKYLLEIIEFFTCNTIAA